MFALPRLKAEEEEEKEEYKHFQSATNETFIVPYLSVCAVRRIGTFTST